MIETLDISVVIGMSLLCLSVCTVGNPAGGISGSCLELGGESKEPNRRESVAVESQASQAVLAVGFPHIAATIDGRRI